MVFNLSLWCCHSWSLRIGIYIEVSLHFSLDTLWPPHAEVRQLGSVGPALPLPRVPTRGRQNLGWRPVPSPPAVWMSFAQGRSCLSRGASEACAAGSFRSANSAWVSRWTTNRSFFGQSPFGALRGAAHSHCDSVDGSARARSALLRSLLGAHVRGLGPARKARAKFAINCSVGGKSARCRRRSHRRQPPRTVCVPQ